MYLPLNFPYNFIDSLRGSPKDFRLFYEDEWLMDTEVKYFVVERKSRWYLAVIYISIQNPFQLIIKRLDSYATRQQAQTYGKFFQRCIRKDKRGTLKMNEDALNICQN